MDYLEDEIDEHTYDDLIPLQIRMALEDQVFGWDHFLSNILGHVGFTVGSYLLTFWMITFVVLREVPWGRDITNMMTIVLLERIVRGVCHTNYSPLYARHYH